MVDLAFILHIITALVLLLATATYLVEFSYRNMDYSKMKDRREELKKSEPEGQKYKGLRLGKTTDAAN